jgi:hypothetical protein
MSSDNPGALDEVITKLDVPSKFRFALAHHMMFAAFGLATRSEAARTARIRFVLIKLLAVRVLMAFSSIRREVCAQRRLYPPKSSLSWVLVVMADAGTLCA